MALFGPTVIIEFTKQSAVVKNWFCLSKLLTFDQISCFLGPRQLVRQKINIHPQDQAGADDQAQVGDVRLDRGPNHFRFRDVHGD